MIMETVSTIEGTRDKILRSMIDSSDGRNTIVIVEGFEMVGKSTFIKSLTKMLEEYNRKVSVLQPDYSLYPNIKPNDRYVIGLSVLDYLSKEEYDSQKVVILDRSVFSSLVYASNTGSSGSLSFIEAPYDKVLDNFNVITVLVTPANRYIAEELYNLGSSRSNNDEMDKFVSFKAYYGELMDYTVDYINVITKYYRTIGVNGHSFIYANKLGREVETDGSKSIENILTSVHNADSENYDKLTITALIKRSK